MRLPRIGWCEARRRRRSAAKRAALIRPLLETRRKRKANGQK